MNAPSPTVARVMKGQLCTGCGLCASVSGGAIEMGSLPPGYSRPIRSGPIPATAERRISAACPGAVVAPWRGEPHPYWGPTIRVETGYAADEAVRFQASSGGAVTALAVFALESGLVDRVVHVAPSLEDPAANRVVVSRTGREIIAGAGSRYVSSSPLADIESLLSEGGRMAFIGKPCDISALRSLATVDPRVEQHVPIMIAFFCAGIPSRDAVGRVLEAMEATGPLAAFRYRGHGWPGNATARLADGRVTTMSYEDSWGGYLSKEVQFRCKICPDAVGGVADIACADAWYGGETGYPTFVEMDGRSLILARTGAGEALLSAAIAAGAIVSEPLPIAEIDLMQPSQAARKRLISSRVAALFLLGRPRPVMRGLAIGAATRRASPKEMLRNTLGTIRRALNGSLSRR